MNITNISGSSSLRSNSSSISSGKEGVGQNSTAPNPTSTVTVSGKALMYSRLFNTNDLSSHTNVETRIGTADVDKVNYFEYLTQEDRSTIESSYEYAASNNIDLKNVDAFASDLGIFRKYGSVQQGDIYTSDGRKITPDFVPSDKVIANKILGSDEIKSTKIDKNFLSNILDSNRPAHAVNFEFLEHLVGVFSETGGTPPSGKFSDYQSSPNNFVTKISEKVNQKFVIEEPDLIKIDGKGYIENPKKQSTTNKDYLNSVNFDAVSKYIDTILKSPNKEAWIESSDKKKSNTLVQNMWKLFVGQK